jgi:hypothetical protein
MKSKKILYRLWSPVFIIFALLLYSPYTSWSAHPCGDTTDIDCDGFDGTIENPSFPFFGGLTASELQINMIEQPTAPSINLFYFINFYNNDTSTAPVDVTNHLLFLMTPPSEGGLNLHAHKIPEAQVGPIDGIYARQVSTNGDQKAIHFIEETDDALYLEDLGSVPDLGTVQDVDYAWVYTNRMRQLIDYHCGDGTADDMPSCNPSNCQSSPGGNTCGNLFKELALHTFAHEAGHMLGGLAIGESGGHTRRGTIMDSKINIKTKGGTTYFYINNNFRSEDYDAYKVRSSWPPP